MELFNLKKTKYFIIKRLTFHIQYIIRINQVVYNVLFPMLARVGRFDPQQLLHLSLSNGSPLCIQYFFILHFTHCSHVFLDLPLPLNL